MKTLICIIALCACVAILPAAAKKKKGIPPDFTVTHTGSGFANVLFEFRDATEEAWPMFFHGKTDGTVEYAHNNGKPKCSFSATSSVLSLHHGDQSTKILGEMVIATPEEYTDKKGVKRTRTKTTIPQVSATVTAAGALEKRTKTVTKKGKDKTVTTEVMPTKVSLTVNGKTVSFAGTTTLGTRGRDGAVGVVNWNTTGKVQSTDLGIEAFSSREVIVKISTSLYPARKKKKRK